MSFRLLAISLPVGMLLGLVCSGYHSGIKTSVGSQTVERKQRLPVPKGQVSKLSQFAHVTSKQAAKAALEKLGRTDYRGKDREIIDLAVWLGNHSEFLELSDLGLLGRRDSKTALGVLMPMILHNNPEFIHSVLADGDDEYHQVLALTALGGLARRDPTQACGILSGLPDTVAARALESICSEMDKDHLPEFVEWWRHSGVAMNDELRAKIGLQYAHYAPDLALKFLQEETKNGSDIPAIQQKIVESLWDSSPQKAVEYVRSLGDEQSLVAKQELFSKLAETSPELALELAADGLSPGSAASALAVGWAKIDPAGAADWALGYDPSSVPASLSTWMLSDAEGAERWILANDLGTAQSSALRVLANHLSHKEPQSALNYALQIENPQMRERTLLDVARTWYTNDPERALSAIMSGTSSDNSLKQRLDLLTK
ncbi:MAG: hypothetical protein ACI9R3_006488 [Verrucomicrobiales bacterium]|jgi:hypothetical protein